MWVRAHPVQLGGQPHILSLHTWMGRGGHGEKPPPAAFSQGHCKPPEASAAGALRSPVQEEKIPFQKGSFINANKVKLFNKPSPRSRVEEIYFCIIALSRDLEAIFFFAVNLLEFQVQSENRQALVPINYLTIPHGNSFSICFPITNIISAGSTGNSMELMENSTEVALVVKNLPDNARDERHGGSTPGSERSPGEGRGNPLQ